MHGRRRYNPENFTEDDEIHKCTVDIIQIHGLADRYSTCRACQQCTETTSNPSVEDNDAIKVRAVRIRRTVKRYIYTVAYSV